VPGSLSAAAVPQNLVAAFGPPWAAMACRPTASRTSSRVGNYRFTPTTCLVQVGPHAATQNENRRRRVLPAPAGRSSADAEMTTTLAQAGIKARPMPRLTLLANVRYEKKEDDTPVALYNVEGGPTTAFTNSPASKKRLNTKLEGSYLLPADLRATLGIDLESVDHGEFTPTSAVAGLSGLKQKTKEQGYRVELRRSMSESLNGFVLHLQQARRRFAVAQAHSGRPRERRPWRDRGQRRPVLRPAGRARPQQLHLQPHRDLPEPVQGPQARQGQGAGELGAERRPHAAVPGRERQGRAHRPSTKGLSEATQSTYSVDASFRVSEEWSLSGYASTGKSTYDVAHSSAYMMKAKDTSTAFGAALKGKVSDRMRLSADLTFASDKVKYPQELARMRRGQQRFPLADGRAPRRHVQGTASR